MKKKTIPVPLSDALTSYFKQAGITKRVQQAGIIEEWAALVGPQIAAVTAPESITPDGMLRVRVATAPWANELSLMAPRILARLNAGRSGRVKEIRWVPGFIERERPKESPVTSRQSPATGQEANRATDD